MKTIIDGLEISERAKDLWRELHGVGKNEEGWVKIQRALDAEGPARDLEAIERLNARLAAKPLEGTFVCGDEYDDSWGV